LARASASSASAGTQRSAGAGESCRAAAGLAELCRKKRAENGLAERCTIIEGDVLSPPVRKLLRAPGSNLVASCPPYYPVGNARRVNPDSEEAIAA